MSKTFFKEPTQVKFYDNYTERWLGGIGYGDKIICGECGFCISVEEIEKKCPEVISNPIKKLEWINISEEILGEN